jgi:hypothetical protein
MATKIMLVIAVFLGLSSVAYAGAKHKSLRYHWPYSESLYVQFQDNWNVSY